MLFVLFNIISFVRFGASVIFFCVNILILFFIILIFCLLFVFIFSIVFLYLFFSSFCVSMLIVDVFLYFGGLEKIKFGMKLFCIMVCM